MMKTFFGNLLLPIVLCFAACERNVPSLLGETERPHIIILLADDLGNDVAPCHSEAVRMPFLESLCNESVVLERAYTHPVCTPSRATLMTSRHPFQHGANDVAQSARKLTLEETTLAERLAVLEGEPYMTAGFGKWHLGDDVNGGLQSPNLQGFGYFEGTPRQHQTYDYWDFGWWRNGDLVKESVPVYRTTYIVDRVIDYFQANNELGPQFIYVGFTNPHLPFHLPPNELHSYGELPPPPKRGPLKQRAKPGFYEANTRDARLDPYFFAMLEALDHEIERLVFQLREESERPILFLFAGDNGTSAEIYQQDTSAAYRAKGMLYEGGAAVPIQIWGHGVAPKLKHGRSDQLFHFADIGPTLLSMAGAASDVIHLFESETSGVSQASILRGEPQKNRDFVYLERGTINGAPYAIGSVDQNGFKLIIWEKENIEFPAIENFSPSQIEFYDTDNDPGENANLFEACEANFEVIRRHFNYIEEQLSEEIDHQVPIDLASIQEKIQTKLETCKTP